MDQQTTTEQHEDMPVIDMEVQSQLAELDGLLSQSKTVTVPAATGGQSGKPPAEMDTSSMCTALLTVVFAILAGRKGEHWILQEKEAEQLGVAVAAVLDKYAPDFQGGPEATLIVVGLLIVGPRAMVDIKARKEMESDSADTNLKPDRMREQASADSAPVPVKPEDEIIYGDSGKS